MTAVTARCRSDTYTDAVIGFSHGRIARLAALVLAASWMVTLAAAETSITPPMRCQRSHMPCCPNNESCSRAQCTEQVSERAEAQAVDDQMQETHSSVTASLPVFAVRKAAAWRLRELTPGLHFYFPVFGLKDDLRI